MLISSHPELRERTSMAGSRLGNSQSQSAEFLHGNHEKRPPKSQLGDGGGRIFFRECSLCQIYLFF